MNRTKIMLGSSSMFSKKAQLSAKRVFENKVKARRTDPDQTITVRVDISANHDLPAEVVSRFERDLENLFVPHGYTLRVEK